MPYKAHTHNTSGMVHKSRASSSPKWPHEESWLLMFTHMKKKKNITEYEGVRNGETVREIERLKEEEEVEAGR